MVDIRRSIRIKNKARIEKAAPPQYARFMICVMVTVGSRGFAFRFARDSTIVLEVGGLDFNRVANDLKVKRVISALDTYFMPEPKTGRPEP
jgi:hypothetical protein